MNVCKTSVTAPALKYVEMVLLFPTLPNRDITHQLTNQLVFLEWIWIKNTTGQLPHQQVDATLLPHFAEAFNG